MTMSTATTALVGREWPRVALREAVLSVRSGFASGDDDPGGVIQFRMNNVTPNGEVDWSKIRRISPSLRQIETFSLLPGDVLFNATNSRDLVGKTTCFIDHEETILFSNHFLRVRPDPKRSDGRYISHVLRRLFTIGYFRQRCIAWVNQATFTKEDFEKLEIPLPPLEEQRRIAAILDKADTIRHKRTQSLGKTHAFLRSVFFSMVGPGNSDFPRWPQVALGELASADRNSFVNGPFGSNLLTSELQASGVPVVYIRDIASGWYKRRSNVFVTEAKAIELASCECRPGDVLVAKVGDPPGAAAIYPNNQPHGIVTQDVIRIRSNRKAALPTFLWAFFNSEYARQVISPIVVEATRSRVGLRDLKSVEIRVPPMERQRMFHSIVRTWTSAMETNLCFAETSGKISATLSEKLLQ